jgi:uncharacterized glyoxalase superfamily protein PhnB
MPGNRSMPGATVTPELPYRDVPEAAAWLVRAFGFTERLRIGNHRAQLSFGDGAVVLVTSSDPSGLSARLSLLVRVDDLDRHCEAARNEGARIVSEPADYPYGERQYTAEDPGGHRWTFSQSIADVDPAAWGGELLEPVQQ